MSGVVRDQDEPVTGTTRPGLERALGGTPTSRLPSTTVTGKGAMPDGVSVPPSGRRARNRKGQGHRLRDDILAAARTIIEESGDEADVTLSEIARRVGVSVPAIYRHFPNVASICSAVVESCWHVFAAEVIEVADPDSPASAQIASFAHRYVSFARRRTGMFRVLQMRDNTRAVPSVGEPARAGLQRLVAAMAAALDLPPDSTGARDAGLGLWIELHGVATLPPAHPRLEWPSDTYLVNLALRRSGIEVEDMSGEVIGREPDAQDTPSSIRAPSTRPRASRIDKTRR